MMEFIEDTNSTMVTLHSGSNDNFLVTTEILFIVTIFSH